MKKMFFILLAIVAIGTISSCKDDQVRPNVGVGIYTDPMTGKIRVQLSVSIGYPGYPAMYGYPMYGNYFSDPMQNQTSVAYIISRPMNQNTIIVYDNSGRQMGVVNCVTGDWRECNRLYEYIRGWDYSRPFAVLVYWTSPGEGNIVG